MTEFLLRQALKSLFLFLSCSKVQTVFNSNKKIAMAEIIVSVFSLAMKIYPIWTNRYTEKLFFVWLLPLEGDLTGKL